MKRLFSLILSCGLAMPVAWSQTITGTVTNSEGQPLQAASVYWVDVDGGTITNQTGVFTISAEGIEQRYLVASFVGYQADTVDVGDMLVVDFSLEPSGSLDKITVEGQRTGVTISDVIPVKTEIISQTELAKAACCDLAGCFETQATVQPHTTNIVTNAKELRILGLSGVYNQVLVDNFPMIQGLSYTYGISSIPGTLVDKIFVSKGANSVIQGYDGISGQINIITKDPGSTDKLLLNGYINSFLEKQVNANFAWTKGPWSNLTVVHSTQPGYKMDHDGDQFLDMPLLTRYMLMSKWTYGSEADWGWSSTVGLRMLHENRIGGQVTYNQATDKGSATVYGQSVRYAQPEAYAKLSYRPNDNQRFQLYTSGYYHDQYSYFGTVHYGAKGGNAYAKLQSERLYGTHNLKTGLSLRHQELTENISFTNTSLPRTYDGRYVKRETIPGAFVENTMNFWDERLTWIAGVRADRHPDAGVLLTPRTLIKADITPTTIVRANIGTGWRSVNLFSENMSLLVSSRDILILEPLRPEQAMNTGLNVTRKFFTDDQKISGHISLDAYHTRFQNQIFPDYDSDPGKALISNFTGESVSNGFQADLLIQLLERFEVKGSYNYLDVYRRVQGVKQVLPFTSQHRWLATFSYNPPSRKFHFDVNIHWLGEQQLPSTKGNPLEHQRPDESAPYAVANAQLTYAIKKFEVYTGCENIFDFRQERPILGWQDPFGPYFDISSVWGPTRGREIYLGFRYRLKRTTEN